MFSETLNSRRLGEGCMCQMIASLKKKPALEYGLEACSTACGVAVDLQEASVIRIAWHMQSSTHLGRSDSNYLTAGNPYVPDVFHWCLVFGSVACWPCGSSSVPARTNTLDDMDVVTTKQPPAQPPLCHMIQHLSGSTGRVHATLVQRGAYEHNIVQAFHVVLCCLAMY